MVRPLRQGDTRRRMCLAPWKQMRWKRCTTCSPHRAVQAATGTRRNIIAHSRRAAPSSVVDIESFHTASSTAREERRDKHRNPIRQSPVVPAQVAPRNANTTAPNRPTQTQGRVEHRQAASSSAPSSSIDRTTSNAQRNVHPPSRVQCTGQGCDPSLVAAGGELLAEGLPHAVHFLGVLFQHVFSH